MSTMHHSVSAEQLTTLLSQMREVTERHHRGDLTDRLRSLETLVEDTEVRVVFVGQFKQGKSALVNALVAAPVCPVDDVIATAVPTVVRWGERTSAALVTEFSEEQQVLRSEVDPRNLRHHVTELAGDVGLVGSLRAEVMISQSLLADGLVLVDTPGFGRAQVRA